MELIILALFAAGLLGCVWADQPLLYALLWGYALFFGYGIRKQYSWRTMLTFSFSGVKTVKNILLTFVLIGVITAVWRACGTIAYIVYHAADLCVPSATLLATFLLCCLVSFLTGTAFGSAATMGVICMTMANSMGISPLYAGGAILSGVFFGDRCSPMSTSALLVSMLTKTNLFHNIALMFRSGWVPFGISCVLYGLLGMFGSALPTTVSLPNQLADAYHFHGTMLLPAVVILGLSLLRVNVKITLSVSILLGSILAMTFQEMSLPTLLSTMLTGFRPTSPDLMKCMGGGGIVSMVNVFFIVCLSSCYAGMFQGTGFLHPIQSRLQPTRKGTNPFHVVLLTSVVTSAIACNQSLAIMLTHQICADLVPNRQRLGLDLENTVVVIAPLIPWSIASAVPLGTIGAPTACILTACYLYLLPLWSLFLAWWEQKKKRSSQIALS